MLRRISKLTEWGLCGCWPLHAGAVISHIFIWAGAHWSAGAEQTQPLTFLPVTWVSHCTEKQTTQNEVYETQNIQHRAGCHIVLTLWLLVSVVEDYIRSVVDACGEILHCAFAKLVHPEDDVIDIGDTIYVVLKYVYAEWMEQIWTTSRSNWLNRN